MILPHNLDKNEYHGDLQPNYAENGPCRIVQGHSENVGVFVRIKGNVLVTFIQFAQTNR